MEKWAPGSFPQQWTWRQEAEWLYIFESRKMKRLKRNIKLFGMRKPILLGEDKRVWDGHHRVVAAWQLKLEYVPIEYGYRKADVN